MNVEDTTQNPLNHQSQSQQAPLPSPIRNELLMQHMQNMQNLMNPTAFADLAYTYFGRPFSSQIYPPHPTLPIFYPPTNEVRQSTTPPLSPNQASVNDQIDVTTVVDRTASDEEESSSSSDKTPKKKNFSISSILER